MKNANMKEDAKPKHENLTKLQKCQKAKMKNVKKEKVKK